MSEFICPRFSFIPAVEFILILKIIIVILLVPSTYYILNAANTLRGNRLSIGGAALPTFLFEYRGIEALNSFELVVVKETSCDRGASALFTRLVSSSCCTRESDIELASIVHLQILADVSDYLLKVASIEVEQDAWAVARGLNRQVSLATRCQEG
jgi:hypothetical protein